MTLLQQSEDLARARSQGELASVEAQINASLERAAAESSLQAAGLRGRNLGDLLRGQAASSGLGLQSDVSRAQLQQVSAGLLHQANQLELQARSFVSENAQEDLALAQQYRQLAAMAEFGFDENVPLIGQSIDNIVNGILARGNQDSGGSQFSATADVGGLIGSGLGLFGGGAPAGASPGGITGSVPPNFKGRFCIDGNTCIVTPDGTKRLSEIEIGGTVMTEKGFRRVTEKDYGVPWVERSDDYVRIWKDGQSIVCTKDHPVNGIAAGEWHNAVSQESVLSGDLGIEGADSYVTASGFVVTSLMNKVCHA